MERNRVYTYVKGFIQDSQLKFNAERFQCIKKELDDELAIYFDNGTTVDVERPSAKKRCSLQEFALYIGCRAERAYLAASHVTSENLLEDITDIAAIGVACMQEYTPLTPRRGEKEPFTPNSIEEYLWAIVRVARRIQMMETASYAAEDHAGAAPAVLRSITELTVLCVACLIAHG